jgi:hypothetical protein
MLVVPCQAVPNQTMQVLLTGQPCTLNVYQYLFGLFMDVYVGTTPVITGVLCLNLNRIVRDLYLGFQGDFAWWDTQGTSDPLYWGIGSRWQLLYLQPSDLAPGEG